MTRCAANASNLGRSTLARLCRVQFKDAPLHSTPTGISPAVASIQKKNGGYHMEYRTLGVPFQIGL